MVDKNAEQGTDFEMYSIQSYQKSEVSCYGDGFYRADN